MKAYLFPFNVPFETVNCDRKKMKRKMNGNSVVVANLERKVTLIQVKETEKTNKISKLFSEPWEIHHEIKRVAYFFPNKKMAMNIIYII